MKKTGILRNKCYNRGTFLTILIILFSISVFTTGCKKKAEKKIVKKNKEKIGLILTGNTSLRIDPLIFSARITLLRKGDTVKITERSNEKSWIGKTKSYWYKVKLENGLEGWLFGKNIRLIASKDKDDINSYVADFFKGETAEMMKNITGKWWSVNRFGDFTYHGLEMTPEGEYRSYRKTSIHKIMKGKYRIDFHNNTLLFDDGATFGSKLQFVKRGRDFIFKKELRVGELIFKRISVELDKKVRSDTKKTGKK